MGNGDTIILGNGAGYTVTANERSNDTAGQIRRHWETSPIETIGFSDVLPVWLAEVVR
jgi:hypothetical protein